MEATEEPSKVGKDGGLREGVEEGIRERGIEGGREIVSESDGNSSKSILSGWRIQGNVGYTMGTSVGPNRRVKTDCENCLAHSLAYLRRLISFGPSSGPRAIS